MKEDKLNKGTVGRSALWSLLEGGLTQLLSLAVFLVTAHFVSPAAFGLLATAMLLIDLSRNVLIEGIVTAVNSRAKPTDEDYNACFMLIAASSAVIAVIIFIFADAIASWTKIENLGNTLRPVSILLLVIGLSRTHEAYLSRGLQFRVLALRSLISITIGGSVGIWMAVHGYGLWSLITQQILTALIALIALWTSCKWRPRFKTNRKSVSEILHYSKHVSATGATNFANNQSDIAFTAYFLGPANAGLYNAAKRIGFSLNQIIATSLNRVAMPTLARVQTDKVRAGRVFTQAVSLTSTVTAPVFAGLAALAPDAIQLVMGSSWAGAAPILSIIAMSYFLNTVGQYNQSVILVYGKPHWQTMLTATYAVINISLFFIFVKYGVIAIATAFTARAVALMPVSIGLALKLLDMRWKTYAAAILPAIVCAAGMGLALALLRHEMMFMSTIARLVILIPLGAVLYGIFMFVVRRESIDELISVLRHASGREKS